MQRVRLYHIFAGTLLYLICPVPLIQKPQSAGQIAKISYVQQNPTGFVNELFPLLPPLSVGKAYISFAGLRYVLLVSALSVLGQLQSWSHGSVSESATQWLLHNGLFLHHMLPNLDSICNGSNLLLNWLGTLL